ncbi:MAG: alpha/beta hydrolase [Bacteroidetes bacterium]|nr:MAG: alpha/beta hydrolase [Bacteroidota bacterium]
MTLDFNFKNTIIDKKEARYLQLNTEGEPAHFYGANGFPLGTYTEFLNQLSPKFKLTCLSFRACWLNIGKAPRQTNWEQYADDLIVFLESNFQEPIIGIGHSQGATATIIAASKRPELFKSLILIEPASATPIMSNILRFAPYFYKIRQQPFKGALEKTNIWESKEAFFEHFRNNKAYKRISSDVLKDFAEFGLRPTENDKFTLTFSSEWELSNYLLAPSIWKYLRNVKIPIQVIAGKPSLFFSQKLREKWKRISPNSSIVVNEEYGHLFPLEAPEICAKMVI